MDSLTVRIKKLDPAAAVPEQATVGSAGADLHACISEPVEIAPGETKAVGTGLSAEIPLGYAGFIFARSGMATKRGLAPANKVGVIDSDYRGELIVALHNHGSEPAVVSPGERIAQLLIMPVASVRYVLADELEDTARGAGGFGSTGSR